LVVLSAAIVMASGFTQNYRVIGALPLAYAIIVSGALIRRARLRNDLSYGVYIYAFPIQQMLASFWLVRLNPVVFFVIATAATLPVAASSWFVVEKRATELKTRIFRRSPTPAAAQRPVTP
jgi:peptidoglycan/LPS O-acetylase OafA/YrhL